MSVLYDFEFKKALKRANELKGFLLELDSICDQLYNRLEFSGVWESLMQLEDVRVRYYTEYYEHNNLLKLKGKNPNVK